MNLTKIFFALALLSPLAAGCAVDAQNDEGTEPAADEAELSAAGKALIGAYEEKGVGDIRALVLTSERVTGSKNRFVATIRTGIVCVVAPCPTEARVEGTWSATKSVLTLSPEAGKDFPGRAAADKLRGKYDYDLVKLGGNDAKLHLDPRPLPGGTIPAINIPGSLEKVTCSELDQFECQSSKACFAKFGSSHCSPPPNAICTKDFVFKGCVEAL